MMKNHNLIALAIVLCLLSCKKHPHKCPQEKALVVSRFVFTKAANPTLPGDVEGEITGSTIKVVLHGVDKISLRAQITSNAISSDYDGGLKDFTKQVVVNFKGPDGKLVKYVVNTIFRDLYFVHSESSASRNLAVYWKNTDKVSLTDPAHQDLSELAQGVFVKDNDVYIAGSSTNLTQQNTFAVYWKNGQKIKLPNGNVSQHAIGHAKAIKVVGNDIYVLGGVFYPGTTAYGDNAYLPVYWKNGVLTPLGDGKGIAEATSIDVQNGDCYVTGYVKALLNENYRAAYWKNGSEVKLTDGNRIAVAQSIAVVGNDVHVVGVDDSNIAHWKNGNKIELGKGMAFAVHGIGDDLFIAAQGENGKGSIWKNGTLIHSVQAKSFGFSYIGNDSYLFATEVKLGRQSFFFYLNGLTQPIKIGEFDHVEPVDNKYAFFIANK